MSTKVTTEPIEAIISTDIEDATDAAKKEKRSRFYRLFLVFQDNEVGPIIGKGGCKIRNIKEMTGCSLSFFSDYHRNRTLNIYGPKENMGLAVKEIAAALDKDETKVKTETQRIPIYMVVPHQMAIHLIGIEGSNSKRIREETKASISVLFEKNSSHKDVLVKIVGSPEQLGAAVDLCIDIIVKVTLTRRQYNRFGTPGTYKPNNRNDKSGVKPLMIESRQSIKLNRELAGVIIGKSGNTITHIRSYSGANVRIENDEKDDSASVIVVGRPAAVARAFDKIEEILQSHMTRVSAESSETPPADGSVVKDTRVHKTRFKTTEAS